MARTSLVLMSLAAGALAKPLRVVPCGSWSGSPLGDGWVLSDAEASGGALLVQNSVHKLCIESTDIPTAKLCNGGVTQQWRKINASAGTFKLQSVSTGLYLQAAATQYSIGPDVLLADPDDPRVQDHWNQWLSGSIVWSEEDGQKAGKQLRNHGGACCGDIFKTRPVCIAVDTTPKCKDLGGAWCDTSLSDEDRVKALLKELTLEEKASNMDSHNFGVPRLGVQPNVFGEALHGMVSGCGEQVDFGDYVSTGCPTSFPQVITLGASWNRSLWSTVGSAVSDELRGLHSQRTIGLDASLFLWSPNVNPFRDPRWGRGQEVASEDPLPCAEFGVHYIKALEEETKVNGRTYLKSVATVKHYFDYDLEGHGPTDRQNIDVNVSKRDQVEYFLPSFKAAVERANVHSTMCSYNAVNGIPACMHGDLINDKMRSEWGFEGFVVSDCDALSDGASHRYIKQHFNGSLKMQAQQSIRGGTDLNCGALYGEQIVGTVRDGLLAESEVDQALERIYVQAVRLGLLDEGDDAAANPFAKLGPQSVDTPEHRALALEAALQGLVLLKNEADTLPLRKPKKLALVGPHANASRVFLGGPNYYGENTLVRDCTPLSRARANLPDAEVSYVEGCDVSGSDRGGLDAAVEAAKDADSVILFLGMDSSIENEGLDRDVLTLPGLQSELALAVAEAAKAPVTVVLANGGPLAIQELKDNPKVGAILEAFFPGQFAAEAIMQTLLGRVSPAGLLPVTVYAADFVDRRPITNLDLRADGGVTYRYFDGEPLWPLGFGLSYTSFVFTGRGDELHTTVSDAGTKPLCLEVTVENTGRKASDVVLLGFISSSHEDAPRNGKLCDFTRAHLVQPGEKRTAKLCAEQALSLVDSEGNERVLPGEYTISVGVKGGVGGRGAGSPIGKVVVDESIIASEGRLLADSVRHPQIAPRSIIAFV